jgi:hypothetical protein
LLLLKIELPITFAAKALPEGLTHTTAPTIPCDGVARGLQRFQPRRLALATVGAENRNSNGGHRVL